jgi:hypothetical protein
MGVERGGQQGVPLMRAAACELQSSFWNRGDLMSDFLLTLLETWLVRELFFWGGGSSGFFLSFYIYI